MGTDGTNLSKGCPPPAESTSSFVVKRLTSLAAEANGFVSAAEASLQSLARFSPAIPSGAASSGGVNITDCSSSFGVAPTAPSISIPVPPAPGAAPRSAFRFSMPSFDASAPMEPSVSIPSAPKLRPDKSAPTAPGVPGVSVPTASWQPLPDVPALADLQIPDFPDISIDLPLPARPDFEAAEPTVFENNYFEDMGAVRAQTWSFLTGQDHDAEAVRARWREMLLGGTGLPIEVEQALFDRGISREEVASAQAISEAQTAWAARGFSLPGSTVLAQISEARQANRYARAQLNREITIQSHEQSLQNLRFAVEQGVSLEQQFTQKVFGAYDIGLKAADSFYRVAQAAVEVRLQYMRMLVEVYQADIAAYKDAVQIELSKLEVFRAQIEGERLRGDLNMQKVEIYKSQLQGVLAHVEQFKAEVEAAATEIRAGALQIDVFRGQVDGFRGLIEADKVRVDSYATVVRAEQTKVDVFKAFVQAFAEQVRAYGAEVDAASKTADVEIRTMEADVRAYGMEVDANKTIHAAQVATAQAQIELFKAGVQAFSAQVQAQAEEARACAANNRSRTDVFAAETDAAVSNARVALESAKAAAELQLEAMRGVAQTSAQLAASAMAAVNVGATVSHSGSDQRSCSYSENLNTSVSV